LSLAVWPRSEGEPDLFVSALSRDDMCAGLRLTSGHWAQDPVSQSETGEIFSALFILVCSRCYDIVS
jgi:hypothetical protein